MTMQAKLIQHRVTILAIAARNGARNLRVFGSVARGEADEASDLDLLVTLDPGRTLFDLGGLVYELTELLGVPVGVVTDGALRGRFRERVLADAMPFEELAA
jgi:hypothetical protein